MAADYPQLEPLRVINLREHIEHRLRAAILSGAFGPGERLVESAIAEHLSVSRGPVREALTSLEREGLVVHVPRKGYTVVDFTEKDVDEVYSLRLLLETEALRRAMDRLNKDVLDMLQKIVDEMGAAVLQHDEPQRIVDLDLSFHECICRAADHSRLYAAWHSMCAQTRTLVGLTSRTHYQDPEEPRKLHQRILEAIRARDLDRAQELLADHILDAQRRATMALEQLRTETGGSDF
jgi:DNA-binding GntR family transcriptional regulator